MIELTLQQLAEACSNLPDPKEWAEQGRHYCNLLVSTPTIAPKLAMMELEGLKAQFMSFDSTEIAELQFRVDRTHKGWAWEVNQPIVIIPPKN